MVYIVGIHLLGYIHMVLLLAFILNLSNTEWTIKKVFLAAAIIMIPNIVMVMILGITLITVYSGMLLMILTCRLLFKQSWKKCMFMGVLVNFAGVVIEYIALLISHLFLLSMNVFIYEHLFILRVIASLYFVSLYIISRKFRNSEHSPLEHFASNHWIIYFLVFAIFADFNMSSMYSGEQLTAHSFPEMIVVILFLVFFLYNLIYLSKLNSNITQKLKVEQQLEITKLELETQRIYAESQIKIADDLRGFRHDYGNVVNSINGYVRKGNLPDLERYMQAATVQLLTSQTVEIIEEVEEIPALHGILTEKISRAKIKRINLRIAILAKRIDLKFCSDFDYSRMIGILLDNALEAAEKTKQRAVEFVVRDKYGRFESRVKNSCSENVDVERIFERGYSTKTNPSGEGLYQLRLLQEKYQKRGHTIDIKTIAKDGYFTQVLKI